LCWPGHPQSVPFHPLPRYRCSERRVAPSCERRCLAECEAKTGPEHRFGRWPGVDAVCQRRLLPRKTRAAESVAGSREEAPMGKDVSPRSRPPHDRGQYRQKMQRCLDTFARMLAEERFTFPRKHIGLEVELNLVDSTMRPSMSNAAVLSSMDDELFTTELSQHNIELKVPPRPLDGESALKLEDDLHAHLGRADTTASEAGAHVAMIGILPTIGAEHFDQKWITNNRRYDLRNGRIRATSGEWPLLSLEGRPPRDGGLEGLHSYADSFLPAAACTSVQLHLQVAPDDFAAQRNA